MRLSIQLVNKKGTKLFIDTTCTANNLPLAKEVEIEFLWDKGSKFKSADVLPKLQAARNKLISMNSFKFAHLEPSSGWGGLADFTSILTSIIDVMQRKPKSVLRVF